jgi:hypothetical protein
MDQVSEYDLEKSKKIGQLYPVLVDAKGNVIDGFHRLEVDPNWRKERMSGIDTEEKLLIARSAANWHRRQVTGEEKEEWINGLARIYKQQGLKAHSKNGRNEIMAKIMEVTGLSDRAIGIYLRSEYKQKPPYSTEKRQPVIPASERIEHQLGREYVERHRKEVEHELRPRIEKEVRKKIIEEEIKPIVKDELRRDVDFIREAIEKAPEVLPTLPEKTIERARKFVEPKEMSVQEGTVYTVGEYECIHCKRHYLIKCDGKRDWVE